MLVGLRGTASVRVSAATTAQALGSGDVPVFGTPALIALLERAAVNALSGHLRPEETTVGTAISVSHLAATPIGGEVVAEAELIAVDGRKLTLTVVAFDADQKVAEGRHDRVIVSRKRFLSKLAPPP
ncbi:MAG TPA: thioesterase family protein [Candidatus Sulfotelmatobacter sp.]|nr:thioesterase family protein [Candidatus Sulfotelmatobacter sp.]